MDTTAARPQHLEALARANEIRLRRCAIRRHVRARRLALTAVIREEGLGEADRELLRDVPALELLTWGWRVGDSVARRILARAEMRPSVTLGRLSTVRRELLAEWTEELAPHACEGFASLEALELHAELEEEPAELAA